MTLPNNGTISNARKFRNRAPTALEIVEAKRRYFAAGGQVHVIEAVSVAYAHVIGTKPDKAVPSGFHDLFADNDVNASKLRKLIQSRLKRYAKQQIKAHA